MITVRECQFDEVEKFRKLEGEYHYMGKSHGAGDMIRLILEEEGKWIALMTWAAACYALKPRDERGSSRGTRTRSAGRETRSRGL